MLHTSVNYSYKTEDVVCGEYKVRTKCHNNVKHTSVSITTPCIMHIYDE